MTGFDGIPSGNTISGPPWDPTQGTLSVDSLRSPPDVNPLRRTNEGNPARRTFQGTKHRGPQ